MLLYIIQTMDLVGLGPLSVILYPSFRVLASTLTALLLTLIFFPRFIQYLRRIQHGISNVREDTPDRHQEKSGTPTMGGAFIIATVFICSLLWGEIDNALVNCVLIVLVSFGAIGFIDDYAKVRKNNSKGLTARQKLLAQAVIFLAVTALLLHLEYDVFSGHSTAFDTRLAVPFVSVDRFHPNIGWMYLPFAFCVIVGTSNAVNLTDGLDGLAIGPTVMSAATFLILAYAAGLVLYVPGAEGFVPFNVADYLRLPYIEGVGELSIVCGAIIGAGVGFLWFNTFPASVFMGDVGSLGLGGALGCIAVLTKNELLSAVIHGVFLVEALSVMTQVISFKTTGKRVFKMAPIHHHFELKGWAEPKIIVRFWIVAFLLALISLASIKLR